MNDRTGCKIAITKFQSLMYVHVPKNILLPIFGWKSRTYIKEIPMYDPCILIKYFDTTVRM